MVGDVQMIKRVIGWLGFEKRTNGDDYWANWDAIRQNVDGNAESVSAVYACVSAISETIASLPLHLYERGPDMKKARYHSLYTVLHSQANSYQSALEFREWMMASV